ncbi:MAG: hypothetical protein M1827_007065 [Pycnora praestabilis]|nr:MAG: hypothetical protein M1827_007065 [Pycnora praestabilis]
MPSVLTSTTTQTKPVYIPKLSYKNANQAPTTDTQDATRIASAGLDSTTDESPLYPPRRPYIPRLAYRTNSNLGVPRSDSASAYSSSSTVPTISTPPSSPGYSERSHPELGVVCSGPPSPTSPASPGTPTKKGKKKSSSIFGFFTLKEPSTQAFADFQEHALRQAAARNGRIAAVGMPGVSSAKLPPTVPKTNSKWDGVPKPVKEKETSKRDSTASYARAGISGSGGYPAQRSSSTVDSSSSRGHVHAWASKVSDGSSQHSWSPGKTGSGSIAPSVSSRDFASPSTNRDSLSSPSTTSLPVVDSFFPPQIPEQYRPHSSHSSPESQPTPPASNMSSDSTLLDITPVKSAPLISVIRISSDRTVANSNQGNDRRKGIEPPPVPKDLVLNSSGPGILPPPTTTRRKQKADAFLAGEAEPIKTPEDDLPPPISKIYSKQNKVPDRPSVTSYFAGNISQEHDERVLIPTPQGGGKGLFWRGKKSMFSKS